MKKLTGLLIGLIFGVSSYSQTITYVAGTSSINACGNSEGFEVSVSGLTAGTKYYVLFKHDEGIVQDGTIGINPSPNLLFPVDTTGQETSDWSIAFIADGPTHNVVFTLHATCSSIEPDGTKDAVDTAYVSTSPSPSNNFTTAPYSIKSPVIQYNAAKSSNMSTQAIV